MGLIRLESLASMFFCKSFTVSEEIAVYHMLPHASEGISYNIFELFEEYDYMRNFDLNKIADRIRDELIS